MTAAAAASPRCDIITVDTMRSFESSVSKTNINNTTNQERGKRRPEPSSCIQLTTGRNDPISRLEGRRESRGSVCDDSWGRGGPHVIQKNNILSPVKLLPDWRRRAVTTAAVTITAAVTAAAVVTGQGLLGLDQDSWNWTRTGLRPLELDQDN